MRKCFPTRQLCYPLLVLWIAGRLGLAAKLLIQWYISVADTGLDYEH
jgi:hypothetical protein